MIGVILLKLTLTLIAAYLALSVARQVHGGLPPQLRRLGGSGTTVLAGKDATAFYLLAAGTFLVAVILVWGT